MNRDSRRLYTHRNSDAFSSKLKRLLTPPAPLIHNPAEPRHFALGKYNLSIGGAGRAPEHYINLDLFPMLGVSVAADAEALPFPDSVFTMIECDAVLEHVQSSERVMAELKRVLEPGSYIHLVTPFCHSFHEYPKDYRRFTPDGLKLLAPDMQAAAEGWRTGPTATLLVFMIEYAKLWSSSRVWRVAAHGILGWALFPFRYLDLLFFRSSCAGLLGNHCYLWLRKPPHSADEK